MKIVNNLDWTRATKIALCLFGFYLTLSLVSHTFDGDFGWHLRFGKNAWSGNFQYTDSYTWSYFGQNWVNHEWGGDLVFWLLYDHSGYFSLVIFISLALWLAFLLAPKIFTKQLTPASILISALSLLTIKFIIMLRLSMLSLLFFLLLWWSLEKIPEKKTYYWWPLLLWFWSFFHGSWILGFIAINIYLAGHLLERIISKKTNWNLSTIKKVIGWQTISGIVIMVNPYGWKIWSEVVHYFLNNFYKLHINEWLPSYSYPVYWWPIIMAAVVIVMIYFDFYFNKTQRQITWPRLLLFIAFFISAMQYRRNNMFLVLICVPALVAGLQYIVKNIGFNHRIKNLLGTIIIFASVMTICLIWRPVIRYNNDVWRDKEMQAAYGFPVEAVDFLSAKTKGETNTRLFNRYAWGGYLNWRLPNAMVYLDGRSAATWLAPDGESLLKKYFALLLDENKLADLETNQVKYIILNKSRYEYPPPQWTDKLIFKKQDIDKVLAVEPYQLEKDLDKSQSWKKIYSDQISNVWELAK